MTFKRTKTLIFLAMFILIVGVSRSEAIPIGAGDSFKFLFDLSSATPPPPYVAIDYQIVFESADLLELGEGWSVQVFDEPGIPLSPVVDLISPFNFSTTGILTSLLNPLDTPLTDGIGFLEFNNIIGTFDLSLTAFVRAWTVLDITQAEIALTPLVPATVVVASPVPEPSTVLLLGSGLAGLGYFRRRRKAA